MTEHQETVTEHSGRASPKDVLNRRWVYRTCDRLTDGWCRLADNRRLSLLAILLLFGVMSVVMWPVSSLWVDETSSHYFATLPWPEFWENLWRAEANMSLYYLLLKLYLMLGFDSEFGLRLPSAIFGLLGVALMYRFVRNERSAGEALAVALLLVINPLFIKYAWEARAYSMLLLFAALTIPLFWKAVETGAVRWFIAYGLIAGLSLYAHIFMLLLYVAMGLWLLGSLHDHDRRPTLLRGGIVAHVLMILVATPILLFFAVKTQSADNVSWIKATGLEVIPGFFIDLVVGRYTFEWNAIRLAKIALLAIAILFSYGLFLLWGYSGPGVERAFAPARAARYRIMLGLLTAAPVVILGLAALIKPLYVDRYLIYVMMAFVPLIVSLFTLLPRSYTCSLVLLVAGLSVYGLRQQSIKPQWELGQMYSDLAALCKPGDALVIPNPSVITSYRYYLEKVPGLADCNLVQQPSVLTRDNFYKRVTLDELRWPEAHSNQTLWIAFSSVGSPLHSINELLYEKSRLEHGVTLTQRIDYGHQTSLLAVHNLEP